MSIYLHIVAALLCSLGISWFMIPNIILISFKKKLFDYSDGRKVHSGIVPRLGGVAFMPAIIISMALVEGLSVLLFDYRLPVSLEAQSHHSLLLAALLMLYFEGTADDLVGITFRAKFIFQALCALLVVASGLYINDLYGLFGITKLPSLVGQAFSVVVIVFVINAMNLIDGIDGLASGLSIIALLFFGVLFAYQHQWLFSVLSFTTIGALVPFYYYNVFGTAEHRHKIFMGDAGSQTIGLVLGIIAIKLSQSDVTVYRAIPDAAVVAFSLLLVPCFDVVRVFMHRIRCHKNPFMPDMNHIHHKFMALGFNQHMAMITIIAMAILFDGMNLGLIGHININLLLTIDVVIWTVFHIWLTMKINKKRANNTLDPNFR